MIDTCILSLNLTYLRVDVYFFTKKIIIIIKLFFSLKFLRVKNYSEILPIKILIVKFHREMMVIIKLLPLPLNETPNPKLGWASFQQCCLFIFYKPFF